MMYYGRSTDGCEPYQPLITHLEETSKLMGDYCEKFTLREIGEVCGMLHDIGKYSNEFQRRVRGEKIITDHSTGGAKTVYDRALDVKLPDSILYTLLSHVIAGHHSGLPDMGSSNSDGTVLCRRLENCNPELFSAWKTEIKDTDELFRSVRFDKKFLSAKNRREGAFSLFIYTHFLFSSLIDADRTSAQNFSVKLPKPAFPTFSEMREKLDLHMQNLSKNRTGELNEIRNRILNDCIKSSESKTGMFTLTVPTGGGKTLSSLSFALNHAIKNNLDRIIYTIPFTSIIEQNADVYKKIFGEDNVLEHHCNFMLPRVNLNREYTDYPEGENLKLSLAASNWDAPLILTTNVQFFESLFSAHPSRSRKVHNIANSVIILDEVQALPNELIKPCMYALCELVRNYNCSVVLCTATQPEFSENKILPDIPVKDIVGNYSELADKMKRAECEFIGKQSTDEIKSRLLAEDRVLCIVNTKRHALDLYNLIKDFGDCYHLSTNMYPEHRKRVINEIRRCLDEGKRCRVVSTQLIEAGVDIDFPVVYRSLSGVDSIAQAAGRCNREGKLDKGRVYVFEPEDEYTGTGYLKQTAEITGVFKNDVDLLSPEAISRYFRDLFEIRNDKLDKDILKLCEDAFKTAPSYPFDTISDKFKMISDGGYAVAIPVPEADKILSLLNETNVGFIQVKISQYSVNVRGYKLNELYDSGKVRILGDSIVVLSNLSDYDFETGLAVNKDDVNKENDYSSYII